MEKIKYSHMMRIGKGYVEVPNKSGVAQDVYSEVWFAPITGMFKIKLLVKKGTGYSFMESTKDEGWWRDGSFIIYWIDAAKFYKGMADLDNRHGCSRTIHCIVSDLVRVTHLRVFEEPRKWLTDHEKKVAELAAIWALSADDVEYLLKQDVSDLLQAFHDCVNKFNKGYNSYCRAMQYKQDQFKEFLKTPFGYVWLMQHYPHASVAKLNEDDITYDYCTSGEILGNWLFEYKETMKIAQEYELTGEVINEVLKGASFKDALREWDLI